MKPSFLRFFVCCPFGKHRPVFCDDCGQVSCLDCLAEVHVHEVDELPRREVEL